MAIKRKYIIITAVVLCIIAIAAFAGSFSTKKSEKFFVVEKGPFEASLNCKGEINGLVATPIPMPKILGDRELRIWQLKILDLTQDGKYVKKGDFIIQLDASQIISGMREERQKLETEEADLKNAKIDSTVRLTELREDIKNAKLDLEYNKIDLEQSVYESAAYQRKAQMTYQKAENLIAKKQRDYQLEQNKLKMRVGRSEERVKRSKEKIDKFQQAMQAARITAPEDGIVIFGESWDGTKYSKDGNISTWSNGPPIATLPDMSEVLSETYVKEIDISKINVGDKVNVSFDALEGVVINGDIKSIARVGEDHKDFDMKVFKVIIHLDESNDGLKPAMSSNNDIILASEEQALFVPINAVVSENGEDFVYLSNHSNKQKTPVTTGVENEAFVLIKSGLQEGDKVILNPLLEEN
ncbi:efflux RND transporter periplasmic adaptor subunit [Draconibacterium halophilum]|uniref:HlyD family efflux transporter periplasmic adaptor subunit n=1 Tax=Draconibacterium halophilum TaxID=2706887 RepID=A0A6C0R9K0_9BACT|nr:efflux RND transporter periplasmic adaptor subunit [Draconibacterium halophilum]QIA07198.1 HlyD family efflux transporter periplasmic adaptor subunit [Draconibacterium halophilum]